MEPPTDRAMAGRVCIVTGANSGIGKETARGLARMGATVVLACRDEGRGRAALAELRRDAGSESLDFLRIDLASQASVRDFVRAFEARHGALDVLVNNAGIYTSRRVLTEDGIERTFAVNHVSHFLLTSLLLDRLRAGGASRVVTVSSGAHRAGTIRFEDLNGEARWSGFRAYAQSKLANVLFTRELARRLEGTRVTANAVHPGLVRTNFGRREAGFMTLGVWITRPFMISASEGADTPVYLASSPDVEGVTGRYFVRRRPEEPSAIARDAGVARRLWEVSERLAGLPGSAQ